MYCYRCRNPLPYDHMLTHTVSLVCDVCRGLHLDVQASSPRAAMRFWWRQTRRLAQDLKAALR